jgi:F-type H+-transporting ATPase subunit delta
MIVGSIARRYAKALFVLAVEQGKVDSWAQSLVSLKKAVDSSAELREVLQSPVYTREQRQGLARQLSRALGLEAQPASLLALLADRDRLDHLAGVAEVFGRLADEQLGRVRARVTSAAPLEPAVVTTLEQKLASATQAQVILEKVVDPALLGGAVTQVGSLVYDGSLRAQLEDLRRTLKQ